MKFDYAATTPLVRENLGSDFVGIESSGAEFLGELQKKKVKMAPRSLGDPDYKISFRGRLLRSRKPRREVTAVEVSSDGDSFVERRKFTVEDILIEARRKDGRVMLYVLWTDFEPADASWVSATDLNADCVTGGQEKERSVMHCIVMAISYHTKIVWHTMSLANSPPYLTLKKKSMAVGLHCGL